MFCVLQLELGWVRAREVVIGNMGDDHDGDLDLMMELGLPTSFGGRKGKDKGKNGTNSKKRNGRGEIKKKQTSEYDKYYAQRYQYFSLFDYGVMIDDVGWYSVTPEEISIHVAERCACDVIIDAFCGVGGNTIQFAKTCNHVIAVDLDPVRLACARHNATIYGVAHKIDFILGSFLDVIPRAKADVVFLAPPWGGPDYIKSAVFDLKTMIPLDGEKLYRQAKTITQNICYQLPKNTSKVQVARLAGLSPLEVEPNVEFAVNTADSEEPEIEDADALCEVEDNYLGTSIKMITAYFGNLIKTEETDS